MTVPPAPDRDLLAALARQRDRGLLGPAPVEEQWRHSLAFARASPAVPGRVVDLGSGGGVPGLPLAVDGWPTATVVLLDASQRRTTFLELEVAALGLAPRVAVVWSRTEAAGRDPDLRGGADLVVARSLGSPAVVAEGAAPLLRPGGHLVVSDPPAGGARWDGAGLARLGMEVEGAPVVEGASFTVVRQVEPCPDRYPRRVGVPARNPLF